MYTFDENIVSDLHKDARGYRPTEYFWEEWTQCGDDTRQAMWDNLCRELEETMNRDYFNKITKGGLPNKTLNITLAGTGVGKSLFMCHVAALALCERLEQMYELGAKDEVQALKWIMEAEEFDDSDLRYGASYFCYHFGLSYSAANEFRIQEAINEMLSEVA
jgi:hypothetical protein